jgi:hypothetical protein
VLCSAKARVRRFVNDLTRRGYNHIHKEDFLIEYQHERLETFQSTDPTVQNSFAASGLVPIDAEKVLSKLSISLRTPSPPSIRPSSRSSQFTPKTPITVVQLQKQASLLKDLLHRAVKYPSEPSQRLSKSGHQGRLSLLTWRCITRKG